jgi:uncharacterized membrane protein
VSSPAAVVFAADKQKGIDLRAMGQEPGWYLTLDEGHHIVFAANSMEDSLVLVTPSPTMDSLSGATVYRVRSAGRRFMLAVTSGTCHDPLNDVPFDVHVVVTLDDTTYRGCGKRL